VSPESDHKEYMPGSMKTDDNIPQYGRIFSRTVKILKLRLNNGS
jgi:hypothetical protein